ncbi:MAG: hypothetical protein KA439_11810 [Rhizobacter sp.]|nr:hypothetical protein [Rhizobacter sp.]
MRTVRTVVIASLLGLSLGIACAQGGGGKGPGSGAGPMGAGPDAGAPGMGMGSGTGAGRAQWGSDFTPGWTLMSQQERNEHRDRMRSMKSYEECHAYQAQHHEQMAARAKERGGAAPAQPRRDACAGLKK